VLEVKQSQIPCCDNKAVTSFVQSKFGKWFMQTDVILCEIAHLHLIKIDLQYIFKAISMYRWKKQLTPPFFNFVNPSDTTILGQPDDNTRIIGAVLECRTFFPVLYVTSLTLASILKRETAIEAAWGQISVDDTSVISPEDWALRFMVWSLTTLFEIVHNHRRITPHYSGRVL